MYRKRYPCNLLRLVQRNLGILDHGGFFFTAINFTRNRVKKILYSEIGSSFRHEESTMYIEHLDWVNYTGELFDVSMCHTCDI